MIELIFTLDYEIYGNGEGSLQELVFEPAERLKSIFEHRNARFVSFIEVAELEVIEAQGADEAMDRVKSQIRAFHREGFELGLHLHPQWYNARREGGTWRLDYNEYNLCALPRERIAQILDRSISYLRRLLQAPDFMPFSFRAGNWLFQPARTAAEILAERGIRIDTSVFKGGVRHAYGLDYRRALKNGYYWKFAESADIPDQNGALIEIPIYSQMVPLWRMFKAKRIDLERTGSSGPSQNQGHPRLLDMLRFRHPMKLDFCRMTIDELTRMVDGLLREDRRDPTAFRPIVAIGHTKELRDFECVDLFLSYLGRKNISISTFDDVYARCQ